MTDAELSTTGEAEGDGTTAPGYNDQRHSPERLQFLAGICSIPVATSVLFRFGQIPAAITFAAIVLAVTAVLSGRIWWYDKRRVRA